MNRTPPIFLGDVDSLETGEQNKVAEPVSLTRQSLDEGGIAVAVRVGAELEKAKKRIEELEGERDAANMAAEKASETSRVALEETEKAKKTIPTLESQLSIYVANRASVQAAIEKAEGEKREALARVKEVEVQLAEANTFRDNAMSFITNNCGVDHSQISFPDFLAQGGTNCSLCLTAKRDQLYNALEPVERHRKIGAKVVELSEGEWAAIKAALGEVEQPAPDSPWATFPQLLQSITEVRGRALAAEAEAAKLKAELGEECRRMTDEIERLSTAVEWVLQEVQETICAQRGYSGATVEEYFQANERVKLPLRAQDVKMLQSAINPAATPETEKEAE